MSDNSDNGPRVWIGCLACYNDGRLVGHWYDATTAADVTPEDLHGRPTSHEELWVMDHEGFAGLLTGECSPMEAQRLAEIIDSLPSYVPVEAFAAYVSNGAEDHDVEGFEESFAGEYDSVAAYAEELAEEIGAVPDDVQWPLSCIDWHHAGRELEMGGDVWTAKSDGGVYVFRSI